MKHSKQTELKDDKSHDGSSYDITLKIEDLFGKSPGLKKDQRHGAHRAITDPSRLLEQNVIKNQNEQIRAAKGVKYFE